MQPAKKKLQIRRPCRFEQSYLGRRQKMQRRAFLMRASAGVAATAIARPAIAQTGAPVRWRLATSWPKSLDTLYGSVEAMCQRVGQMTDRKFQIQCFAGGEIVPPLQVWDATQNGTVECGHTLTSFNIGKNPAVAFDSGLAFGLNTRQQQAWMNYGGGLEIIRALFKKDGILPIPCGNVGVQMGGFYRKEINSVDDLKGLKFRIGGLVLLCHKFRYLFRAAQHGQRDSIVARAATNLRRIVAIEFGTWRSGRNGGSSGLVTFA